MGEKKATWKKFGDEQHASEAKKKGKDRGGSRHVFIIKVEGRESSFQTKPGCRAPAGSEWHGDLMPNLKRSTCQARREEPT